MKNAYKTQNKEEKRASKYNNSKSPSITVTVITPTKSELMSLHTDLVNQHSCPLSQNFVTNTLNFLTNVNRYFLKIIEKQAKAVEMVTHDQSQCKQWYQFRAGRVTTSRFKAAAVTDLSQPSQSLIKQIRYPESCKFTK